MRTPQGVPPDELVSWEQHVFDELKTEAGVWDVYKQHTMRCYEKTFGWEHVFTRAILCPNTGWYGEDGNPI